VNGNKYVAICNQKGYLINMTFGDILSSESFKKCVEFHGHVCPGLAIGFKAAQALMSHLGVTRAPDEEMVAIIETDACGADAIQVMTGCTLGKGNLILKNFGKHAFSLADRRRGRVLRVCLRSDAIVSDPEHLALFEKVRKGEAKAEEIERFGKLREKRIKEILEADSKTLFIMEEIEADIPQKARIVESAVCDRCREPTMVSLLQEIDGQKTCIPCAQRVLPKEER
jgi:formylmethanofuran dehydrogenase subunit E